VRKLTLADAAGRPHEVECHVVFSLGGPFAVEAWQAIPGTPLDMPAGGGVHHIGYWVDDLAAEAKRLDALGYPRYATAGAAPLLNRGPAGTLVEPCDLHSDRPSLRDLFPPESEFAGEQHKENTMRIAIIGAGNMGATLAARLTQLGHQVAIANSRGPQALADVAARTGATPVPVNQVTHKADVVIVAIPEKSIPDLPAGLLSALPQDTVVIDAGNYVPKLRDGHIDAIDAGLPESQWVQAQLRHPVVEAFNTIRPASLASLGKLAGAPGRTAIPVACDNPAARAVVLELADQLGFDGLDAGPLAGSWRQQPGTPVYTTDLPLNTARQALADATPEQTASWRAGAGFTRR
jgi:8-hydroxy-5-deazaflavin:NADPH oxidoreductase